MKNYPDHTRISKKKQASHPLIALVVFSLIFALFPHFPAQAATPRISINNGKMVTESRKVTLELDGISDVREMKISHDSDLISARWERYRPTKSWTLTTGVGEKVVYVKYKDGDGEISQIVRDEILLEPPPIVVEFDIAEGDDTDSRYVTVSSTYSDGIESFRISNSKNFGDTEFRPITKNLSWVLPHGNGKKTVYVEFFDASGNTKTLSQKITFSEPDRYIEEGSLIKGQSNTVYYYGYDGVLHPYLDGQTYRSWFPQGEEIEQVSDAKLGQYQVGDPACVRPGTWLLKFHDRAKVYAVEPGCVLRPILSEAEANLLFGSDWASRVLSQDAIYRSLYTIDDYSVAVEEDEDEDIEEVIDDDGDGVDDETEDDFGTSDQDEDSDNDKLTDYEEIFYWFTDPTDPDTDGDGFLDGAEIIGGFSPLTTGRLTEIPEDTYVHPVGTLMYDTERENYYYQKSTTRRTFVSSEASSSVFTTNNFQTQFAVRPSNIMTLSDRSGKLGKSSKTVVRPKRVDTDGDVIDL